MKFIKQLKLNELRNHMNLRYFIVEYSHSEAGNKACEDYNIASHAPNKDLTFEMYLISKMYIEKHNNIETLIMETHDNFENENKKLSENHKISIVLGDYDDYDGSYYALMGGTMLLKKGQKSEEITNEMRPQILIYYQKCKINK